MTKPKIARASLLAGQNSNAGKWTLQCCKIGLAQPESLCYSDVVQQPIREIGLPNLIWLLRRIEMAKASTPAKARRRVAADEDDEEDEDEVVVVSSKKKATAPAKSTTNGRANGAAKTKAAVSKKTVKEVDDEATYAPNANSMRDFIMRAMKRGGSSAQIKKRAANYAEKKGVD